MISRPKNFCSLRWGCWLLGCLLMLPGCGVITEGPQRLPVSGHVTAGPDVAVDGVISFLPAAGNTGPAATASIIQGAYQFNATSGPIPGDYQVVIVPRLENQGPRKLPVAKVAEADNSSPATILRSRPSQSLTATVSIDDISFDYDLK